MSILKNNDVTVTVKSEGGETITYKSPKGMNPDMGKTMGGILGRDTIPAMLTQDEHVVNRPAAMKYRGILNAMNAEGMQMAGKPMNYNYGGKVMGYNQGGQVGQVVKLGNSTFQMINGIWTQVVAGPGGDYKALRPVTDPRAIRQLDSRAGSNRLGSGDVGQQPVVGGLPQNVKVPVGADKYAGDRRYTPTGDDGSYANYELNPQGVKDLAMEHRQGIAEAPYAEAFTPMDVPTFEEEQMRVDKARAMEQQRIDAASGIFQEDASIPPRPLTDDPQFDLAAQTAQQQTDKSFKYSAGETYDAPSKEAAEAWVGAGIVLPGAIFRLPNGLTGRAQ